MKLSALLFAFFALLTFVTSIPLLDSVNDGYINGVSVTAKRLDEQNIDKRQLSDAMFDIVNAINVYADEYNHYRGYSRSDFTRNIVQALYDRNPHFNYIICHVDGIYNFGSAWGVNVYDVGVTYDDNTVFSQSVGYDVVIGKNGTFTRYGDGGFINWAYIGNVIGTSNLLPPDTGVTVEFGIPD